MNADLIRVHRRESAANYFLSELVPETSVYLLVVEPVSYPDGHFDYHR